MGHSYARPEVRVGFYAAALTSVTTLVSFGLALAAIPSSGAFCPAACINYPYLEPAAKYPRDFIWMLPAMLSVLSFVGLMVAIRANAKSRQTVFAQLAVSCALISAAILISNYYLQFSVVPASLMSSETLGLALLTQSNPNGIFIALEEIGYFLMSICFLFAGFSLAGDGRLESAVRWIFWLGFISAILSLGIVSTVYGLQKLDRLEVLIISINWLVLILNGGLLSVYFSMHSHQS